MRRAAAVALLGLAAIIRGAEPVGAQEVGAQEADLLNDYPTAARAEYVFACMANAGQNQRALEQCSCSIDRIASILPYESYVEAEAILALQQTGGERATLFRDNALVRGVVADLRRAQAEAEILCF